jgi:hypothetical protein
MQVNAILNSMQKECKMRILLKKNYSRGKNGCSRLQGLPTKSRIVVGIFSLITVFTLHGHKVKLHKARNRLHIYRRSCCTGCSMRTQILTAQQDSIRIAWFCRNSATSGYSSLTAVGLTCLLHLLFNAWQGNH